MGDGACLARHDKLNYDDVDCDGVVTAQDCDDSDFSNTQDKTSDSDCDGVLNEEETEDIL